MKSRFFISLIVFMVGFSSVATTITERPIRVLSIDGGGVRGIIAATVLEVLEKKLNKPCSQIFDFVAGTSTGGIIALGLTAPDASGKPLSSAADLVDMAAVKSSVIFSASWSHWFDTLNGLLGPKYESTGLYNVLKEQLGDTMLSEALIPTLITGYHIEGESGIEFFSEDAKKYKNDKDCLMREVALATAAAPTYFDAVDVEFQWGVLESIADGALYKHNPALLAYASAKKLYPNRAIEVYSLGTGIITAEELSAELKGRGLLQWMPPIVKHLIIGNVDADQTVLHKLLNENGEENYFRINVYVNSDHKEMDDTTQANLEYLYRKGIEATKTDKFARMLERLQKN